MRALALLAAAVFALAASGADTTPTTEAWQKCSIYLAPSLLPHSGGTGVFAARHFKAGDLVDVIPVFAVHPDGPGLIEDTALADYTHQYSPGDYDRSALVKISAGYAAIYNHSPKPNVQLEVWGIEPIAANPTSGQARGFVATKDIEPGEELTSSYAADAEEWFRMRGQRYVERISPHHVAAMNRTFEEDATARCPKLISSLGREYRNRLDDPKFAAFPEEIFPPFDSGYSAVHARVDLVAGDEIESAPMVILPGAMVRGTMVEPLAISLDQIDPEQIEVLQNLRESGHIALQVTAAQEGYQPRTTFDAWNHFDGDISLLPLGSIGMLLRATGRFANCKLLLQRSATIDHVVEASLVATRSISAGQMLKLHVPTTYVPSEVTRREEFLLHLDSSGQRVPGARQVAAPIQARVADEDDPLRFAPDKAEAEDDEDNKEKGKDSDSAEEEPQEDKEDSGSDSVEKEDKEVSENTEL